MPNFDGVNRLIKINQGVTIIDIQTDIYSAWKAWLQTGNNAKFLPALRTIGGDPTVGEKVVAPYFFLMNGWKIKPYSWNHTLNLVGNLFVDDPETYGANIVMPPDGNYTVLVNMSTTSDASKLVVGSGITLQDKLDISEHVWDEPGAVMVQQKVDPLPTDPASEASLKTYIATKLNDLHHDYMDLKEQAGSDALFAKLKALIDEVTVRPVEAKPKSVAEYLESEL